MPLSRNQAHCFLENNVRTLMTEFRGTLCIFVDAFQEKEGAPPEGGPDDVFGSRGPGGRLWYLTGWAVGNNARGTYCARTSTSKLRTFATFSAAMEFVRKKRKTRPDERFHLVYEIDGRKSIVTSLEQILRLDGDLARAERIPAETERDDALEILAGKVGRIVAGNALELHRIFSREGEAAARMRFSSATYERLWQVLREAALVEGTDVSTTPN